MKLSYSWAVVMLIGLSTCAPTPVPVNHNTTTTDFIVVGQKGQTAAAEESKRVEKVKREGNHTLIEQARRSLEDAAKRLREME